MRKRHKRIRNGVVIMTIAMVAGIIINNYKIKSITKDIEYRIDVERVAVDEQNAKLNEMQQQLENMDSLDYVREVATKELKMVDPDTIVIKPKE